MIKLYCAVKITLKLKSVQRKVLVTIILVQKKNALSFQIQHKIRFKQILSMLCDYISRLLFILLPHGFRF